MALNKSRKINLSILISVITLIISLLVNFVFSRFLLDRPQIGDVNYGLKTTADSFTSFISIFVSGMASTFIRFHRTYKEKEKSVYSSFNVILFILAGAAILFGIVLVILAMNNVILDPAKGVYTQQQVYDFTLILVISILFTCCSLILSANRWFLESEKAIVFVRVINLLCVVGYPLISIACVLNGANMVAVTLIYSCVYAAGFLIYLVYRLVVMKGSNPFTFSHIEKAMVKEILYFTLFVVLASFVETFNYSVDKIILTVTFSASYATLYQLSMTMNQLLLSLADTIYAPYVPYISDDALTNDIASTQKTYDRINFLLLLITCTMIIGFYACGQEFVKIWLGEERSSVYYYTLILFAPWPLYGMTKFSTMIHRAYDKHKKASLFYLGSFLLHIVITVSFIRLMGTWSCIFGTACSMIFLGVAFIFYNRREVGLSQKKYLIDLAKFVIMSGISILLSTFVNSAVAKLEASSDLIVLVVKGIVAVLIWIALLCIFYYRIIFRSEYDDDGNCTRRCVFDRIKDFLSARVGKINRLFPFVLIVYFLLNFAAYYLGGIKAISGFISGSAFTYGSKFLSYLVLYPYLISLFVANKCRFKRIPCALFLIWIICAIAATFMVQKTYFGEYVNTYGFTIITEYRVGSISQIIDIINLVLDLVAAYFYVFVLRQCKLEKGAAVFFLFIVGFTLAECVYSFCTEWKKYVNLVGLTGDGFIEAMRTEIQSTFYSKNGFGILLFNGFAASGYLFYTKKKWYFVLPSLLFLIVSLFALCKTSTIAMLLFVAVYIVVREIHFAITERKKFILTMSVLGCIVLAFLFVFVPSLSGLPCVKSSFAPLFSFEDVPLLGVLIKKLQRVFVTTGTGTIISREGIWKYAMELVKWPYSVFGYGKNMAIDMLTIQSGFTSYAFHNILIEMLCSYGLVGVLCYLFALGNVCITNVRKARNLPVQALMIAALISALAYGMMETFYVIISSSCVMIVPNLIIATAEQKDGKEGAWL